MKRLSCLFFGCCFASAVSCGSEVKVPGATSSADQPAQLLNGQPRTNSQAGTVDPWANSSWGSSYGPFEENGNPPSKDNSSTNTASLGSSPAAGSSCPQHQGYLALAYPAVMQSCLESGKLWDYNQQTCSKIPLLTNTPCTWYDLAQSPAGDVAEDTLRSLHDSGSTLTSCGLGKDGSTYIYQYLDHSPSALYDAGCPFPGASDVNTSCLRLFDTQDAALAWAALDKKEQISRCYAQ